MSVFDDIRARARHIWFTMFGALILAYFSYHMFQGNHGIISLMVLKEKVHLAENILSETKETHSLLQEKVSLMNSGNLDLDILDERTRLMLNYGHSNDAVILYSSK